MISRRRAHHPKRLSVALTLMLAHALSAMAGTAENWHWVLPYPQPYTLRSIAFGQDDNVVAVGDGGAVITSTDAGQSWIDRSDVVPLHTTLARVQYVGANSFVAVGGGDLFDSTGWIVHTADGGATWSTRLAMPETLLLDVHMLSSSTGFSVGIDILEFNTTLLRTDDGGLSWEASTPFPAQTALTAIRFLDSQRGFAVGFDLLSGAAIIFHTQDGGASWAERPVPPAAQGEPLFGISFGNDQTGIAVGGGGTILSTGDGGNTWVQCSNVTSLPLHDVEVLGDGTTWAVGGDHARDGVLIRMDQGCANPVVEEFDVGLEGVIPLGQASAMTVGTGGDIRAVDKAGVWRRLQRLRIEQELKAASFSGESGVAVGVRGVILRTSDSGNTWRRRYAPTSLDLRGVSISTDGTGMAVGGEGNRTPVLLATNDFGESWIEANASGLPSMSLTDVECASGGACTVVGACGLIAQSAVGGTAWHVRRAADCAANAPLESVRFMDADRGVAVGLHAILRTEDGGVNWASLPVPTDQVLRSVHFFDERIGFVGGGHEAGRGTILRTADSGLTWVVQRDDLPTPITGILAEDEHSASAVSMSGSIYGTTDSGATWSLRREVSANLSGIESAPDGSVWVPGFSQGNGVLLARAEDRFSLVVDPQEISLCRPRSGTAADGALLAASPVGDYVGTVSLSSAELPQGMSLGFAPAAIGVPATSSLPSSSRLSVEVDHSVPFGEHIVRVVATDGPLREALDFRVNLLDPERTPTLSTPKADAADVELRPSFGWQANPLIESFRIQIALDSGFQTPLFDTEVSSTTYRPEHGLDPARRYFWRVRAITGCEGAWSPTRSFTTVPRPSIDVQPKSIQFHAQAGAEEKMTRMLEISNTGTGYLGWTFEVPSSPMRGPAVVPDASHESAMRFAPGEPVRTGLFPRAAQGAPMFSSSETCETAPGMIIHDDGSIDTAYSVNPSPTAVAMFVDRFTPVAYPAYFHRVCLSMGRFENASDSMALEVVVLDDDGPQGGPGTELGALPVVLQDIVLPQSAPSWTSHDISALGISVESGSVYVGVRWVPVSGHYLAADESDANPPGFGGGYWWDYQSAEWTPLSVVLPSYRSLFVRAAAVEGGCDSPASIPWLRVEPRTGTTADGESSEVEVTALPAGLAAGQYAANLCLRSNSEEQSMVVVPVKLTIGADDLLFSDGFDPAS